MRAGSESQAGFTLVAMLLLLALMMLGLSLAGPQWSQQLRREREQELLRVGSLYAQALARYRDMAPGSLKQYPARLEQLTLDTRFVGVARHLRELYPDPIDPSQPWGLVLDAEQRIVGVYSQSKQAPLAQGPIERPGLRLAPALRYSDWEFVAKPSKP